VERSIRDRACYHGPVQSAATFHLLVTGELTLPLRVMHGDADILSDPDGCLRPHRHVRDENKTLTPWPRFRDEFFNDLGKEHVIRIATRWLEGRAAATVRG
jgi:alpha-beta hydrolase superfamily lysophospholipase